MWLPEDERRLLRFYYSKLDDKTNVGVPLTDDIIFDSIKAVGIPLPKECSVANMRKDYASVVSQVNDVRIRLECRKLIRIDDLSDIFKGMAPPSNTSFYFNVTLAGSDFIRKYKNLLTRCGLWWQEHKCNPVAQSTLISLCLRNSGEPCPNV